MTYESELLANYMHLSNTIEDVNGLIKPSKVRQIVKLNRYISRARGCHVASAPYLTRMISGRPNRTPWKVKGLPYIPKAKRWLYPFATGGYVNAIEMNIEFPSGLVFVNRID